MKWSELLKQPAWSPLSRLCQAPVLVGRDYLFQIDSEQFVLAWETDKQLRKGLPDAPFVPVAIWAHSVSAAKRFVFADDSEVVTDIGSVPEELLFGAGGTYGELFTSDLMDKDDVLKLVASYSMSSGNFVYKGLNATNRLKTGTSLLEYGFLARSRRKKERPFAIRIDLPD